MLRRSCLLALFICPCLIGFAQTEEEIHPLEPGQIVEREIAGGKAHAYRIRLSAEQFARFIVEQKGVNVALQLVLPGGGQMTESNFTFVGGLESLSFEAATGDVYRLTVLGASPAAIKGGYRLRMETKPSASELDRRRITAERLLAEALNLSRPGSRLNQQSLEKSEQATAIWHELGDKYWEARALAASCYASRRLSRYDQALAFGEQALAIAREVKDRAVEGYVLNNMGIANSRMGRQEKALEYAERYLALMRELGDRDNEGTALSTLGTIYTAQSRYNEAIECLEQEIAIYSELGNVAYQRYPLHNLGDAYMRLGRYEEALKYAEQALSLHREAKDRFAEAATLDTLGEVYSLLGRYDHAVVTKEQALQARRETNDRHGEATSLDNLGHTWRSMGRPEKAIEYFEQSLAIYREVKDRLNEASLLAGIGMAYSDQGGYEKAIEHLDQSLQISREVKSPSDEAEALKLLGLAYTRVNRHDQALGSLEQALSINRGIDAREKEGETLIYLGNVHYSQGRYEKAKECYEQALAIHREAQSRAQVAEALYGLARVERDRGDLDRAHALIEEALKITESLRANIYNQEARATYFASVRGYSEFYVDLLMRLDRARPARGFGVMAVEASERARARGLLELLTEAGSDIRQGADRSLIERERSLARQMNARAILRSQRNSPEQLAALKKEIGQLENDYEQVQAAIRRASPHYAAVVQPQPLKLAEIQQQLDSDTLLLEYELGEERSYLWAITPDTMDDYELPGRERIEQAARHVLNLLVARGRSLRGETPPRRRARVARADSQLPQAARQLSRMLLSPVGAKLGDKRLVIVADGALQYIPFAILPVAESWRAGERVGLRSDDPRSAIRGPQSFTPLVVKHEVVSLPSASALAAHRRELAGREPAPNGVAVIADPVFYAGDERVKSVMAKIAAETPPPGAAQGLASTRIIEHLAEDSAKTAAGGLVIPRLPFTRQEADRILAAASGSTNLRALDFKADHATATGAELSRYRYVHFATHGLLDSERPGLSALALSLVDEQGKPQDGFLRAHDVYNLNLPAELVTLSACQTGLGKEIKGEGLVGLTRGFMYAGASRVVVSLWNVNDKATSELMARFYQKILKEGRRPATALRSAQVEMWRNPQWRAPYFWAAFVLQGEWR
jgi:CHAT domain-containing protein/uncharacterized protein HemY